MSSEISCNPYDYLTSARSKACLPTCFKGDFHYMAEDHDIAKFGEFKDHYIILQNFLGHRGIYDLNLLRELGVFIDSEEGCFNYGRFTCKIPHTNGPLYLISKDGIHVVEPRFKWRE